MTKDMREFKAALIDLDGFLIDSEGIFLEANKIYFKQFGLDFTERMHISGIGKKTNEEMQGYIDRGLVKADISAEELVKGRDEIFREIALKKLKLLPGAQSFLEKVRKKRKNVLVTSSTREYVNFIFSLLDISKYFDEIVTGDMVKIGKPSPEPYLIGASTVGLDPDDCMVFEDAVNGVLSGKAAGMRVIAVPNRFVKGDKVFEEADMVFESLVDVSNWLEES